MKVVCDIDGVLADSKDYVRKYLLGKKEDWDEFFAHTLEFPAIPIMIEIIKELRFHNEVTYVTGRPERNRKQTAKWLKKNLGNLGADKLIMRADGDHRDGALIKLEACHIISPDLVIEDEPNVVRQMNELGYKVLQVHGYRTTINDLVPGSTIPRGVTCHYDRIDNRWFVVWDGDFHSSDSGRLECNNQDSLMLEMGWQVGRSK